MTPSIASFLVLFALSALDYWLTARVIEAGGTELNPLLRFSLDKFGFEGMVFVKLLSLGLVFAATLLYPQMLWVNVALCVVYAVICINNYKVLQAQKETNNPSK